MPDLNPYPKYASVQDLYKDRGGHFSQEKDYGVNNIDVYDSPVHRYQVSVVADTGDIYAKAIYFPYHAYLLGQIPGADDPLTRPSNSIPPVYNEADLIFDGWQSQSPGQTLEWFYQQLKEQNWASEPRPDYLPPAQPESEPDALAPGQEAEAEPVTHPQKDTAE